MGKVTKTFSYLFILAVLVILGTKPELVYNGPLNPVINPPLNPILYTPMVKPIPQVVKEVKKKSNKKSPIIRILYKNNTMCTAFVISDTMAMTADHCVNEINAINYLDYALADKNKKHYQAFIIYKTYKYIDQAILLGDFRRYDKLPMKKNTNGIEGNIKQPFKSCGYSHGGKLQCYKWKYNQSYGFSLKGNGFIYPGMSGGPLINMITGQVMGVNSAVGIEDGLAIISPLVNTKENFGLTSEE